MTDPALAISVTPTTITRLDVAPYNDFAINCTASKPAEVIPDLVISWSRDGQALLSGQDGVSIATGGGVSQLAISAASVASAGDYSCTGSLTIVNSATVEASAVADVTIQGIHFRCGGDTCTSLVLIFVANIAYHYNYNAAILHTCCGGDSSLVFI